MSKYAKSVVLEMLRESFGDIQNVNWLDKEVEFEVKETSAQRAYAPPFRIERRNFTLYLVQSRYNPDCAHTYRIDTML